MEFKHLKSYHEGHPNPQFYRDGYINLNGEWDFVFDEEDEGIDKEFYKRFPTNFLKIKVPFPYQAKASGIGLDKKHCDVVWYRKKVNLDNKAEHYKLTFLGSDYETYIYINGVKVGKHEGAYDLFSFDIKPYVKAGENEIIVRCYDKMRTDTLRGKQRWRDDTFECFYTETNGLFKDVYLENLSSKYIDKIHFKGYFLNKKLRINLSVNEVSENLKAKIYISFKDELVLEKVVDVKDLKNEYIFDFNEVKAWNFNQPNLYEVEVDLLESGEIKDKVLSYFGFTSVESKGNRIFIDGKDTYLKLVLDQGYFPNTITSPTEEQIINDLKLIKEAGFNGLRKHEKIESPLYYYYLDLMGLYVWQECPSAHVYSYDFNLQIRKQILRQIDDHISHPSIISYVIINESWGVWEIERSKEMQDLTVDLYNGVKKIVEDRFVVSNDGWEHTKSDLITVHNYSSYKEDLEKNLTPGLEHVYKGEPGEVSTNWKKIFVGDYKYEGQPVLLSEFAGIAFTTATGNWGYGNSVKTEKNYFDRYASELDYILSRQEIRGFCMTQLTDVEIEVNGVYTFDRKPKMSIKHMKELHDQFK